MIAWSIALSIILGALGDFAINLAIAYAITKKLITRISSTKSYLKLRLKSTTTTRWLLFIYKF